MQGCYQLHSQCILWVCLCTTNWPSQNLNYIQLFLQELKRIWHFSLISCVACPSSLAGGEKETHWEWHRHHRVPGRGWRLVVLQTVDDPIALHPYPSLGRRGDYVTWSDVIVSPFQSAFPLTRRPDIFALVRYNSQNDSYRWVLWSGWI